jgi:hypothetical protein
MSAPQRSGRSKWVDWPWTVGKTSRMAGTQSADATTRPEGHTVSAGSRSRRHGSCGSECRAEPGDPFLLVRVSLGSSTCNRSFAKTLGIRYVGPVLFGISRLCNWSLAASIPLWGTAPGRRIEVRARNTSRWLPPREPGAGRSPPRRRNQKGKSASADSNRGNRYLATRSLAEQNPREFSGALPLQSLNTYNSRGSRTTRPSVQIGHSRTDD